MKFPKEYQYHGGQKDLAKAIGVSSAAVGWWKARGEIPKARIEEVSAHLKELRNTPDPAVPAGEARKLSDIVEELLAALKEKGL